MDRAARSARLPPRWFVRIAWVVHRAIYRISGGLRGLWQPKPNPWGTMCLTTIGRRTGKQRSVIVAYFEDGPNLVTLAMNGWAEPDPAWWINLQAHPDATVDLKNGRCAVRGRAAVGEERERLWAGGSTWATTSTAMPPGGRGRRRSWSWSPGPTPCPDAEPGAGPCPITMPC